MLLPWQRLQGGYIPSTVAFFVNGSAVTEVFITSSETGFTTITGTVRNNVQHPPLVVKENFVVTFSDQAWWAMKKTKRQHVQNKFRRINAEKIKEGIFVGLQIFKLPSKKEKKKRFLGNERTQNYKRLVKDAFH